MIFGAIMAGGVGARMGADCPKQFLLLGDKPILVHTLERFLSCVQLEKIVIGVHADWLVHTQKLVSQYASQQKHRVIVTAGGEDRNETLMRVIKAAGATDDDFIISHDAVRPFVTLKMIEENIEAVKRYGATGTAVPSVDTIFRSNDGKIIAEIPDRRGLYQMQTPQSFRVGEIKELYGLLTAEEKAVLTDACKICVICKRPVYVVEGAYTNIKITTPEDYTIAQSIYKNLL